LGRGRAPPRASFTFRAARFCRLLRPLLLPASPITSLLALVSSYSPVRLPVPLLHATAHRARRPLKPPPPLRLLVLSLSPPHCSCLLGFSPRAAWLAPDSECPEEIGGGGWGSSRTSVPGILRRGSWLCWRPICPERGGRLCSPGRSCSSSS
jgi:hypothetical protein